VPGGRVRWGERLTEAVVRETREETGVVVAPREVLKVTDQVHRDAHAIRHHFVLVDYLCDYVSGEPKAASDAEAAAWVAQKDLGPYDVPAEMRAVLMDAYSRCASGGPRERGVES
jgi:ADP-ribose pyrophosphatase YjhB (NUDIX family)